jgi:GT2 family glycosyltransferase
MIEFVSATRLSESEFPMSPLGRSLSRFRNDPRVRPRVTFMNAAGLPEVYNRRIESADPAEILVFVHDDVWIEDFYVSDRIVAALKDFDVVGLAGSRERFPRQRYWFQPLEGRSAAQLLAGAVAHGDGPLGRVKFYGPIVAEVELIDGLFMAARKSVLREAGVRFDTRFDFHFYDLDFCRSARAKGLRLGTFPLSVTHRSSGAGYQSESWRANCDRYFEKWKD